jgi:dolichol-phosphate mannosyltransferase
MKTWITIPTYNESENIRTLIAEIRQTVPDAEVLVIDDNSPDGTSGIVEAMKQQDARVHLLLRTAERGRGTAGRDGFKYALEQGADCVVEMDADYSHHPRYLPAILNASEDADVVLGSRYVKGGYETGRPLIRQLITKFVGVFLRKLLGVSVRDPSSGYRCFRREVLLALDLDNLVSTGPSIVSELLYKARIKGFSMAEVPIIFEDRKLGYSKLDSRVLLETLRTVMRLRAMHKSGAF